MFAYNPTVNDRSGEILAQGIMQQNAIRASQQQELAGNIGDAIASIGQGLQKRREDLAKVETSMAAGEAMMKLSQQFGPDGELFRQSYSEALAKAGKNADKIAGATAAHAPFFDSLMKMRTQQAQYDAALELHRQKQALGGSGSSTSGGGSSLTFGFQ